MKVKGDLCLEVFISSKILSMHFLQLYLMTFDRKFPPLNMSIYLIGTSTKMHSFDHGLAY